MAEDPTIGEISRQLLALTQMHMAHANDQRRQMDLQTEQLSQIREQVFKTNGRVGITEEKINTQGREIGEIKKEQSKAAWAFFSLILTVLGSVVAGLLLWWFTTGRPQL